MSLTFYFIHLILSFNTYHRCDWQRTKKQENIRLHYVSLYIYFVPLLASAKKEIVRPTRPTSCALENFFFFTIIFYIIIDFLWKQNLFHKSVGHMILKLLGKKIIISAHYGNIHIK